MKIVNENIHEIEQLSFELGIPEILPSRCDEQEEMKEQLLSDVLRIGMSVHRKTKLCVFVEFYGHVDTLYVSVRQSRTTNAPELMKATIRLTPYVFFEEKEIYAYNRDVLQKLRQTIDCLESFIGMGSVSFSGTLAYAN